GGARSVNMSGAMTSAYYVDLSDLHTLEGVISRRRHGAASCPGVGSRVVHLIGAEHSRRTIAEKCGLTGVLHDRRAANQVDLSADLLCNRRTAFDGHRRQRSPCVGTRVVLP